MGVACSERQRRTSTFPRQAASCVWSRGQLRGFAALLKGTVKKVNEKNKTVYPPGPSLFLFNYFLNYSFFVIHDNVCAHVSADVPELCNDASFNYNDIVFLPRRWAGDWLSDRIDQWLECNFQPWSCVAAEIGVGGNNGDFESGACLFVRRHLWPQDFFIFFKLFPLVGLFSFACLFVSNLLLFNCELPKAVVAITLYYRYTKVV